MPAFPERFLGLIHPPWSNFVLLFAAAPALPLLYVLDVTERKRGHEVVNKGMQNKTLCSKIQQGDPDEVSQHQLPGNLFWGQTGQTISA